MNNHNISLKHVIAICSQNRKKGYLGRLFASVGKDLDTLVPTEAPNAKEFMLRNIFPRAHEAWGEIKSHILLERLVRWHGTTVEAEALKELMEITPPSYLWENHESLVKAKVAELNKAEKFQKEEERTNAILDKLRK